MTIVHLLWSRRVLRQVSLGEETFLGADAGWSMRHTMEQFLHQLGMTLDFKQTRGSQMIKNTLPISQISSDQWGCSQFSPKNDLDGTRWYYIKPGMNHCQPTNHRELAMTFSMIAGGIQVCYHVPFEGVWSTIVHRHCSDAG